MIKFIVGIIIGLIIGYLSPGTVAGWVSKKEDTDD